MKPIPLQTPAQLAAHLRAFRKARRLTQAQLVGLDQARIARIEREPRLVSTGQLMRLLFALRVRVLLQPLSEPADTPGPRRAL
jgi:transcriptional regulator with XRE-family HTH domain